MLRRIVTTVTLALLGLLAVPTLASAGNPPYQAPSVTPVPQTLAPVIDPVAYTQSTSLASTGAGFSIGLAVAIGAAVVLVGLVLMVVGNRVRRAGSH